MNVELQQLSVFEDGFPVDRVWVAVVNGEVVDRPNHSRSVKAAKEFATKAVHKDCSFSIHPQCQTKQHKKGRRDS